MRQDPCPLPEGECGAIDDAQAFQLSDWLRSCEREERGGPHVVIFGGYETRCFGPFTSRAQALAAVTSELAAWMRECRTLEAPIDVVPLLDAGRIAPACGEGQRL